MSDRAPATLTLYGMKDKQEELFAILDDGWYLEFEEFRASSLIDGVTLIDPDCVVGWADDGGPEPLRALGISYRFHQQARYEHEAIVELFTPALGVHRLRATQEGEPLVATSSVQHALADATTLGGLRSSLEELSATRWSRAFALLDAGESPDVGGAARDLHQGSAKLAPTTEERYQRLVELLLAYGEVKFGDEFWPSNAGAWLDDADGNELEALLALRSGTAMRPPAISFSALALRQHFESDEEIEPLLDQLSDTEVEEVAHAYLSSSGADALWGEFHVLACEIVRDATRQ